MDKRNHTPTPSVRPAASHKASSWDSLSIVTSAQPFGSSKSLSRKAAADVAVAIVRGVTRAKKPGKNEVPAGHK